MATQDTDSAPKRQHSAFFPDRYFPESCKVPHEELKELLKNLGEAGQSVVGGIGVGLDSCVIPTRHRGIDLVQSTDFFYPLVEDPYLQGKIACANVLSDVYAMGVDKVDNMLMLLGASRDMTAVEKSITTSKLIQGFADTATAAGSPVAGGQTVLNPWVIVGGVASSICHKDEYIMPYNIRPGDKLILTKPLGTQPAVNAHQWLDTSPTLLKAIMDAGLTEEAIYEAYSIACHAMARLNRGAARVMHEFDAHGATDITGFGPLGHATNLALAQKHAKPLKFSIHTLPIIAGMTKVKAGYDFMLLEGYSAETSGGLLIGVSADKAESFCQRLMELEGCPAWIIGDVTEAPDGTASEHYAEIAPDYKIIEVTKADYDTSR
eukprot:Clim_evm11s14 gene=Clim_evmTU11s14